MKPKKSLTQREKRNYEFSRKTVISCLRSIIDEYREYYPFKPYGHENVVRKLEFRIMQLERIELTRRIFPEDIIFALIEVAVVLHDLDLPKSYVRDIWDDCSWKKRLNDPHEKMCIHLNRMENIIVDAE